MTATPLHDIVKRSGRLAETSKRNYLSDLDRWIVYAGSDPKRWTRYQAQEFYDQLIAVEKLKPQSATRLLMSLRYAASMWARLENRPELDFTVAVEFAKNTRRKHRSALTDVQAAELLKTTWGLGGSTAEQMRDFALFVVALETGMRQMSLGAMQLETTGPKLTMEGKPIPFPSTLVPLKGLGTDLFAVPLSDTALLALQPWKAWLARQGVKTGTVFRTAIYSPVSKSYRIGAALSYKTIYNITTRRALAAGLGHVHPHIFRHTFVTWRLLAGIAPEQIAAITLHRLESDKLASLYDYADKRAGIAEAARQNTPSWLAELVKGFVKP